MPSRRPCRPRRRPACGAGRRAKGWRLGVIDAGELDDPDYLANPVNRCFFCKRDLYGTIRRHTEGPIASGTNLDDLGDFRPGLKAAEQHGVRHPFVECGIDKARVRALARSLALDDLAELPAAPCLSSRIETGIPVTAARLGLVLEAEKLVEQTVGPGTLRCRVLPAGLRIELEPAPPRHAGSAGTRGSARRHRPARSAASATRGRSSSRPIAAEAPSSAQVPVPADLLFDADRPARIGIAEAILCASKSTAQLDAIVAELAGREAPLLLTRLDEAPAPGPPALDTGAAGL